MAYRRTRQTNSRQPLLYLPLFPKEMKPTIRAMQVREAKDFLVTQTAEQAALEGLPVSDLEKRMMYFTESKYALEDPASLNEEFEARYDMPEFEKKISRLMSHAHKRLKKEDPEKALQWSRAIGVLRKGDHYILVLAGDSGGAGSIREWRIALAVFLPVGIVLFCIYFLPRFLPRLLPASNPYTLRVMQVLFLALVIAAIFFPRVFAPAGRIFGRFTDWIMGADKEGDVEK